MARPAGFFRSPRIPPWMALLYVLGYVASDAATFFNDLAPYNITPWNPPPALSLVFVYFYGARCWPLVFLAVLLADAVLRTLPSPLVAVVVADLALSLAYTAAGVTLRHLGFSAGMERQGDVVRLLFCALLFSTLAAAGAIISFVGLGNVPPSGFGRALFRFWVGDAVGLTVTAPFLFLMVGRKWSIAPLRGLRPNRELAAQVAAIAIAAWTVFHFSLADEFQLIYPLFIPLIWISVRHGMEGSAFGALAMQIGLGLATILAAEDADRVTELQFAMMAMTATCLLLGAGVSERRRAEQTVLEREQRLRSLFAVVPVGIAEIDGGGRVLAANDSMARLADCGIADLVGRPALAALPGLATLAPHVAEELPQDDDTRRRWFEVSLAPVEGSDNLIAVIADISERKELERRQRRHQAEVAQVERINAAGQLAAAIAHELNQPLTSIIYYTRAGQRLLARENGVEEAIGAMDKAVAQAMRAGDVIRNLRYFLSRGDAFSETVDLGELLREAGEFLAADLRGGGVDCEIDTHDAALPVWADRVQVEQVALNLMRNAIEAMAGTAGPRRLTLTARVDGGFIAVDFVDTGVGVDPEIASELFRPFTTTKPSGMGLGLSISRTIVEAAGGTLDLGRTGPDGTVFVLRLPRAEGERG